MQLEDAFFKIIKEYSLKDDDSLKMLKNSLDLKNANSIFNNEEDIETTNDIIGRLELYKYIKELI